MRLLIFNKRRAGYKLGVQINAGSVNKRPRNLNQENTYNYFIVRHLLHQCFTFHPAQKGLKTNKLPGSSSS